MDFSSFTTVDRLETSFGNTNANGFFFCLVIAFQWIWFETRKSWDKRIQIRFMNHLAGRTYFWTFTNYRTQENVLFASRLLTFSDRSAAKSLSSTILPFWLRCKEWLLLVGDDWPLLSDVGSLAASSFTLSAYLKVFNECSQEDIPGLIIAICVKFRETWKNMANTKSPLSGRRKWQKLESEPKITRNTYHTGFRFITDKRIPQDLR